MRLLLARVLFAIAVLFVRASFRLAGIVTIGNPSWAQVMSEPRKLRPDPKVRYLRLVQRGEWRP